MVIRKCRFPYSQHSRFRCLEWSNRIVPGQRLSPAVAVLVMPSPTVPNVPSVSTGAPIAPSRVKRPAPTLVGSCPAIKLLVFTVQVVPKGEAPYWLAGDTTTPFPSGSGTGLTVNGLKLVSVVPDAFDA